MHLFPNGIDFVTEPFHVEWNRLYELKLLMEKDEVRKDIALLGVELEASRLLRWIERYGDRLGITHASTSTDPKVIALSQWHEGWEDLMLEGRLILRKSTSDELKSWVTAALSLFDQQLALELELERQRRLKQEEKAEQRQPEGAA